MLVKEGDRTCLDARARAEPADPVLTRDFYSQLQRVRLTADAAFHSTRARTPVEVTLDDQDVARLVECAIRHPHPNMRHAVLAAIWNHPDSFRQIFQFGINAPEAFPEIRQITAEELDKQAPARTVSSSDEVKPVSEALLPRMPLPPHLRGRERQ